MQGAFIAMLMALFLLALGVAIAAVYEMLYLSRNNNNNSNNINDTSLWEELDASYSHGQLRPFSDE
jgi:hypothetical protein